MTRNIDELNNLNRRSEEPEEYFKKMDLPEEEKERRIEYTKKANEFFDLILVLALLESDRNELFFASLRDRLETYLLTLINEYTTPDDYLIDYAANTAFNFIDTTEKNIDDPWYTSEDRALYNAENSANDVLNYDLYQKAIAEGKTHKKWITEKDNRVRKTHKPLDGKKIGIKELFYVGGIPMRFPKDYEYAEAFPQETINCRCSIKYLPEDLLGNTENKQAGAFSGALNDTNDPLGLKRDAKAKEMYDEIRNRDQNYEIQAVAKNSGFSKAEIERVYNHIFIREHLLDDGKVERFAPDFYMANSWLRLRNGKKIYPHDITMIKHELLEEKILGNSIEIPARKAHNIAESQFNYKKELLEFLKTHNG